LVRRIGLEDALRAEEEVEAVLVLQLVHGGRLGDRCEGRSNNCTCVLLVDPGPSEVTRERQGRGNFPKLDFSYLISMPCLANKFDTCARLHIGNKIKTLCLLDHRDSLRRRGDGVTEATASQMKYNRSLTPSVAESRRHLLLAVRSSVRSARDCPGVLRIGLLGSLLRPS
jgi:hypothetical protein